MSLAEAALTIEALEAEEAARILRRDHVRRLKAESDRLMTMLEAHNLRGRKTTMAVLRPQLIELFRVVLGEELTAGHKVVRETQPALEHLYEAQDELLDRLHPDRAGLRAREREEKEASGG